jgi:hypothetical protein
VCPERFPGVLPLSCPVAGLPEVLVADVCCPALRMPMKASLMMPM